MQTVQQLAKLDEKGSFVQHFVMHVQGKDSMGM